MKDGVTRLLQIIREQGAKFNPPTIKLGEVISISPLVINLGNVQIDSDDIMIADYLLTNYTRNINIENIPTIGSVDTAMKYTNTFTIGDILAVLPIAEEQTYIVFCKVVSLSG